MYFCSDGMEHFEKETQDVIIFFPDAIQGKICCSAASLN
jgi:hypothetical protein